MKIELIVSRLHIENAAADVRGSGHQHEPGVCRGAALTEKTLGELNQSLVVALTGALENLFHEWLEPLLSPVISGRHLRASRIAFARGLEHGFRRGLVEAGIIPLGKIESPGRIAPLAGVLVYERA